MNTKINYTSDDDVNIEYVETSCNRSIYILAFIDLVNLVNLSENGITDISYKVGPDIDSIFCNKTIDNLDISINRHRNHNLYTPNICAELVSAVLTLKSITSINKELYHTEGFALLVKYSIYELYHKYSSDIVRILGSYGAYSINNKILNLYLLRYVANQVIALLVTNDEDNKYSEVLSSYKSATKDLINIVKNK